MLYVTFHGYKPEVDSRTNNVHAYDKDGNRLTTSVLNHKNGIVLSELRGVYLFGKYLYVVNANNTQNSVLCYEGSGLKYRFVGKFITREGSPATVHPFDLAFDDAGFCYLSSQDTNVVTRLTLTKHGKVGVPADIAPALPAHGKFSPGTFVASSVSLDPPSTPVPPPAGLKYSGRGQKKHSVRGVAWANGALYVADQPAGRIKVYDRQGKFLGQSNRVETPVHLVTYKGSLYVSGGGGLYAAKLPDPPGDFRFSAVRGVNVKNSGGMTFTDSGHLYLASRTRKRILKFDSEFKQIKDFQIHLHDDPEFLLHV